MDDVVWIALISAAGPALVAVVAAIASVFGPAFQARVDRKLNQRRSEIDRRYERALGFIEALAKLPEATTESDVQEAHAARNRFIACLRAGEEPLEQFTAELLEVLAREGGPIARDIVNDAANQIFARLRGDSPRALKVLDPQCLVIHSAKQRPVQIIEH